MISTATSRALVGTPERPTVAFERVYPTDRAGLWAAVTDSDAAARWLGRIVGAPARVGDAFTLELGPGDDVARCTVASCEPQQRLACTWTFGEEPPGEVIVELFDAQGGTGLRLTHAQLTAATGADYGRGWDELLLALASDLEGSPRPDFDAAAALAHWRLLADRALTVEREFAAPVADVWAALTTASGLKRWWWSQWPDVTITADARPGGSYEIAAPSQGFVVSGTYLEVTPEEHVSFTWRWTDEDGTLPDEAVDIRLSPTADDARVTVRHTGPWEHGAASSYEQGWNDVFDNLAVKLRAA